MSNIPLSRRVLREIYDIEIEQETALRIDVAVTASARKMLDLFAKELAFMECFADRTRP